VILLTVSLTKMSSEESCESIGTKSVAELLNNTYLPSGEIIDCLYRSELISDLPFHATGGGFPVPTGLLALISLVVCVVLSLKNTSISLLVSIAPSTKSVASLLNNAYLPSGVIAVEEADAFTGELLGTPPLVTLTPIVPEANTLSGTKNNDRTIKTFLIG
jgi:hypothetical protein